MSQVTLSLISHTNVGKTTLARTLLRRDVGEVRDQAHVTEASTAYELIQVDGDRLVLWDTPGFGDSARLMKLLRRQRSPVGWLLLQVWDRVVDRPLFCSREAAQNVRDKADVVLYLVNASESPQDAGYVALELELLGWIGRPTLLLLNQVGGEGGDARDDWRRYAAAWQVVGDVLSLDAFARCWTEEGLLFDRVARLLEGERRDAMQRLAAAWNARNLADFDEAIGALTDYVLGVSADREAAEPRSPANPGPRGALRSFGDVLRFSAVDRRRAEKVLNERLDRDTAVLMASLIRIHGLEGHSAATIEKRIRAVRIDGDRVPLDERSGALAGAVVSGALSGLAADVLSGGLTLGGGMIAGGLLGALGGAALGRGYRLLAGESRPMVGWSPEFLDRLFEQSLLRYLAVAHFGRGRGTWRDLESPTRWISSVESSFVAERRTLAALWRTLSAAGDGVPDGARERMRGALERAARRVLIEVHPHAAELLEPSARGTL